MNQGAQTHREADRQNYGFETHFAQITVYIQKVWFWKKLKRQPSFYEGIMNAFSHWDQRSSSGWHLLFLMIFTFLSFLDISLNALSFYLFFFFVKEHFLHATESLCGSAPVCRCV